MSEDQSKRGYKPSLYFGRNNRAVQRASNRGEHANWVYGKDRSLELSEPGFRFSPEIYVIVRGSSSRFLHPVWEAFDFYPSSCPKNEPPKAKERASNTVAGVPVEEEKTNPIYLPRLSIPTFSTYLPSRLTITPTATVPYSLELPCSPSTWLSHVLQAGLICSYKRFAKSLLDLDRMAYNSKPSYRKRKRCRRLPALKSRKAFECSKNESKCYVERLNYRDPSEAGKASTTFNAFLKETGVARLIYPASRKGNRNGEVLEFSCKRFRRYDILIDPKWLDEIQAKRDKMFEKREQRSGWQSYKRVNEEYRLNDEDLEKLRTLAIEEGEKTKTYEREHDTIKNGTYPLKQRSGSYYSEHNNIPDIMRVRRQNEKGERLAISDQSSAHGYFLYVELKEKIDFIADRDGKEFEEARADLDKLAKDLESRELYDYIPKQGFVALLNARYGKFTKQYIKDAFHAFEGLYPDIYPFFLGLKNQHNHKLFLPITHRQTMMMEEARDQCLAWGFDAQILGDELEVPESEIMRVKNLMLELIFKYTGLKGWVKVTMDGKPDQRFQFKPAVASPVDELIANEGVLEIKGELRRACVVTSSTLNAEIVARLVQLLETVRIPLVEIENGYLVPELKGPCTANLMLNVIFNKTDVKAVATVKCYDANAEDLCRGTEFRK